MSGSITSDVSTIGTANVSNLSAASGTVTSLSAPAITSSILVSANDLVVNNNMTAFRANVRDLFTALDANITNVVVNTKLTNGATEMTNGTVKTNLVNASTSVTTHTLNCTNATITEDTSVNRLNIRESAICLGPLQTMSLNVTQRVTTTSLTVNENITTPYFNTANNEMYVNTTLNVPSHTVNARSVECLNLTINGKVKENGNDLLPVGSIIMWSGQTAPDGWGVCDGSVYFKADGSGETVITPDLRGRFVLGHNPSIVQTSRSTINSIGDVGGEHSVALVETQLPSHTHYVDLRNTHNHNEHATNGTHPVLVALDYKLKHTISENPKPPQKYDSGMETIEIKGDTNPTGANEPHNNMPPYYVLAYIMKL
jgi:microcystin-dependent protein